MKKSKILDLIMFITLVVSLSLSLNLFLQFRKEVKSSLIEETQVYNINLVGRNLNLYNSMVEQLDKVLGEVDLEGESLIEGVYYENKEIIKDMDLKGQRSKLEVYKKELEENTKLNKEIPNMSCCDKYELLKDKTLYKLNDRLVKDMLELTNLIEQSKLGHYLDRGIVIKYKKYGEDFYKLSKNPKHRLLKTSLEDYKVQTSHILNMEEGNTRRLLLNDSHKILLANDKTREIILNYLVLCLAFTISILVVLWLVVIRRAKDFFKLSLTLSLIFLSALFFITVNSYFILI